MLNNRHQLITLDMYTGLSWSSQRVYYRRRRCLTNERGMSCTVQPMSIAIINSHCRSRRLNTCLTILGHHTSVSLSAVPLSVLLPRPLSSKIYNVVSLSL